MPLTYSLSPGAPAGVSINPTTGVLSWNVPATQRIGIYPVTVIVSDNSSPPKTAYETIDLSVVDPSPPPTISTPTVSTKKGFSITFSFSVPVDPATASDPANYILTEAPPKHRGKKKTPAPKVIRLIVSFDAATDQVTLKAAKKPKAGMVLTLTVVGAGGIAKLDGLQLAGAGASGTNYVATITGKRISHTAAVVKCATASAAPSGPLSMAHIPWSAPRSWARSRPRPAGGPAKSPLRESVPHDNLCGHHGIAVISQGLAPTLEAAGLSRPHRTPGLPLWMEPHQEDMMSHQGWIRSSVSRLVKLEKKGNAGRLSTRPRRANLTRIRSVESLEERTLLSTVSVEPIQDVKTVDQYPAQLTPAGTNLFYVVEDSSNDGQDLVVTNSGGTQVVKDFPDAATSGSSAPTDITAVGNDVDFITSAGSSTAYDNVLWQSNGTAGGTTQVSIPGTTVSTFQSLTDLNGTLIVVLNVGSGIDNQMWAIGGNGATPVMIKDFGTSYATPDQVIGDTLYFSVNGDLWATGGAAGNTQAVGSSVATPRELVAFNGQAYYFSVATDSQVVFGTLTPSGETQVGSAAISTVVGVAASGSSLYFVGGASVDRQGHPALGDERHAGRDPSSSRTSARSRSVRPLEPDQRERDPVLHPGRRGRAGGAVAVQRHQPGHVAGEGPGHECPVQRVCRLPDVARGHRRDGVLHRLRHDLRRGVVGDERHVPGHATRQGHQPGPRRLGPARVRRFRQPARLRGARRLEPAAEPALDEQRHGRRHGDGRLLQPGRHPGIVVAHAGLDRLRDPGLGAPAPARGRDSRVGVVGDRRDLGGHHLTRPGESPGHRGPGQRRVFHRQPAHVARALGDGRDGGRHDGDPRPLGV